MPRTLQALGAGGTRDTSWYSGYTTKGEALSLGERVGVLD